MENSLGRASSKVTIIDKKSDTDILWSQIGSFGRFQKIILLVLSIISFFGAIHDFDYIYIAAEPAHWCHVEALDKSSWTLEQIKNISIPKEIINNELVYNSCEQYDRNYSILAHMSFETALRTIQTQNTTLTECKSWTYDKSIYESTVVSEWNLVCGKTWLMSSIQSIYLLGILFSAITCGLLSDKFGRRPVFMTCIVLWAVAAILQAFCFDYVTYVVVRFLLAFFGYGSYLVGFVLLTEIAGTSHRSFLGMAVQIPFGLGFMAVPGVAYAVRNWKVLQYIFSFSSLVSLIGVWLIPESPRWLIINGKYDQAKKILHQAATKNGKKLSADDMEEIVDNVVKANVHHIRGTQYESNCKGRCSDICNKLLLLVRTREMFKRTSISYFAWFVVAMVYYGFSLNGINLPFNPYLVTFIMATVELPAVIFSIVLIDRFGRRSMICVTFLIAGIACLLQMAPPSDLGWLITTFATIGKLCITSTFAIIYLYEAELLPTEVRNVGIGGASIFARFGAISSPYIINLLGSSDSRIPIIIFGVCSLIAAITSMFLPETNKQNLPETVEEVERTHYFNNNIFTKVL